MPSPTDAPEPRKPGPHIRGLEPLYSDPSELLAPPPTMPTEQPTLRDQFAMAALTGLLSHSADDVEVTISEWAEDAYRYADAMIRERAKS